MPSSKQDQLATSLIQLLPLLFHKISGAVSAEAAPPKKLNELTHLQQHILEQLAQQQSGVSMTELAQRIQISKQQLTPLIVKLEEKGWVHKIQSEEDRRVNIIRLSEKGAIQAQKRWTEVHRELSLQLNQLEQEDQQDLEYAIGKFIRIIGKLNV